jgi:hypothetical protein
MGTRRSAAAEKPEQICLLSPFTPPAPARRPPRLQAAAGRCGAKSAARCLVIMRVRRTPVRLAPAEAEPTSNSQKQTCSNGHRMSPTLISRVDEEHVGSITLLHLGPAIRRALRPHSRFGMKASDCGLQGDLCTVKAVQVRCVICKREIGTVNIPRDSAHSSAGGICEWCGTSARLVTKSSPIDSRAGVERGAPPPTQSSGSHARASRPKK